MKIHLVEPQLFHADERSERHEKGNVTETSPKVDHLHAQLRLGYEYKSVVMLRDENINIVYGCKFQKRCTQYAEK